MAGTKRKHELAELGDLSGTEKVSNSTVSTTDVKQPSSPVIDDSAPVCYLCLDGDLDDDGQPLRRDCACRGSDAGFVHLECLAEYAAAKSKQASDMNKFVEPWQVCPGCHIKMSLELISRPSLYRSSEGITPTIHKIRWKLLM